MPPIPAFMAQARALLESGDLAAAERAARRGLAAAIHPEPVDAAGWNLLGVILRSAARPDEAVAAYRSGLVADPRHALCWSNLGTALKDLKHLRSAIACHRRALALQPGNATLHENHGLALMLARRFTEAEAAFASAATLSAGNAGLRTELALAQLAAGRWAEGWSSYEARRVVLPIPGTPPGAYWDGAPHPDATLLVLAEQGFGDLIWSFRFLAEARRRVRRLVLYTPAELLPLFAAQGVADSLISAADPALHAEFHVQQCSLPGIMGASPDAARPYLTVPPDRIGAFADIAARRERLRIGIVWSGNPDFPANADRALPASRLVQAIALPGVTLYSLQLGAARAECPEHVVDLAPRLADFADTAAAVQALDLIIMTDTAVAHLAGALGREVWVLLNHMPGWIWGGAPGSAGWYGSMRLFRQPVWGAWDDVLDQVQGALLERLAAGRA